MSAPNLQRLADDAADDAAVVANDLGPARERLRDAMSGQPGAQSYDDGGPAGMTGHRWCFDHESEDCGCPAVEFIPAPADPTGEAGHADDRARNDETDLIRSLERAAREIAKAREILNRYSPRKPTTIERRDSQVCNDPGCQSCSRIDIRKGVPRWEPPITKAPTDVRGMLPKPMWLCRWCYGFVRDYGRLPHRSELRDHHAGIRIYVPAVPKPTSAA